MTESSFMKYPTTRMASLLLAFGIFFTVSCAVFEKSESYETQPYLHQLDEQLKTVNQELESDPDNIELRIKKAELLAEYASLQSNPSDRYPIYQNLYSLNTLTGENDRREIADITDILVKTWAAEQSSGIRLLQSDRGSGETNQYYYDILAHFDNAIVLQPDSSVTYNLMATTFYESGSISNAIETLAKAVERTENPKPIVLEKLAYLHLESGNTDHAIVIYEKLVNENPNDQQLIHGLTNAYMISERHLDAIARLTLLSEEFPTRYNYKEALATQLYFVFADRSTQLLNEIDSSTDVDDNINDLQQLSNQIHNLFDSIRNSIPVNEESLYRMGTFYNNSISKFSRINPLVPITSDKGAELLSTIQNYRTTSIVIWERLVELNPDNMEYVYILYDLYQDEGMTEEADSIERSYNF